MDKFNESKYGARDDNIDNSFDNIGFRLAFGPCRDDALLDKLDNKPAPDALDRAFVDDVVAFSDPLPPKRLFCCMYERIVESKNDDALEPDDLDVLANGDAIGAAIRLPLEPLGASEFIYMACNAA